MLKTFKFETVCIGQMTHQKTQKNHLAAIALLASILQSKVFCIFLRPLQPATIDIVIANFVIEACEASGNWSILIIHYNSNWEHYSVTPACN
jgi:hypothetical protein